MGYFHSYVTYPDGKWDWDCHHDTLQDAQCFRVSPRTRRCRCQSSPVFGVDVVRGAGSSGCVRKHKNDETFIWLINVNMMLIIS